MRKKTKRKIYPLFNPIQHAIAGALITDNEILDKFRLLELTSIESFRTGTATRVDWENLARMMNVCEVSAEMGIGAEALPACQCLQKALIEAQERFKKIGRYGLSGVGLKAAKDVFEYIDLQRTSIARSEFEKVIERTYNRMKSKPNYVELA
jgi:hypothetical protein